ncbi:HAD family hydrolase [Flavihumibacter fluvii]|uniref:HAD family hydrolase n=1 Tax=Flavihumibacter fluvii TaxID=2838157 RepID=UPI001BDE1B8D|nr:HAD family phosphatase [Flavihumibacter fluvii]ULQ52214.1 HAD family phosphatase [Flavihumibacter fluvii]
MQPIKNILLDLGGVLLNLSFAKTEQAFAQLGLKDFSQHFTLSSYTPLFEEFEIGAVSKTDFLTHFKKQTGSTAEDHAIIAAWNNMLLDFPRERINWLDKLSDRYRVFLYSNTNAFHYDAFQDSFSKEYPGKGFDDYFEKAYYSHLLGKRKPHPESFTYLMADAGLDAGETLFVDDTFPNIEGAQQAGLQTVHLSNGKTVLELDL